MASSQLAQLVQAFSGQAELLVPINLMHEIAVAVDAQSPAQDLYVRSDTKTLAELLVRTFEAMNDDSVKEVVLAGRIHGVWLATLFFLASS